MSIENDFKEEEEYNNMFYLRWNKISVDGRLLKTILKAHQILNFVNIIHKILVLKHSCSSAKIEKFTEN
jgi:hypothetical protein